MKPVQFHHLKREYQEILRVLPARQSAIARKLQVSASVVKNRLEMMEEWRVVRYCADHEWHCLISIPPEKPSDKKLQLDIFGGGVA
jgi:hypothetical protein